MTKIESNPFLETESIESTSTSTVEHEARVEAEGNKRTITMLTRGT